MSKPDGLKDDSEVRAPRRFSAPYTLRILAEIDASRKPDDVRRILRRDSPHSSLITHWRHQCDTGALKGPRNGKRGPAGSPVTAELKWLLAEKTRPAERL